MADLVKRLQKIPDVAVEYNVIEYPDRYPAAPPAFGLFVKPAIHSR